MSLSQNKNKKSDKANIQIVHAEAIVESPLIPMHVRSRFATVKEWLFNISDGMEPSKPIKVFIVDLSKSSIEGYLLRLYGVNSYANETHGYNQRIDYQPKSSDMYFIPAKSDYKNLDYQQFKDKVIIQLKEVLSTQKLKTSFLAEAEYIFLPFSGEKIFLK